MLISEISIRRPIATIVIFVALSAIGIIAARLLPLEAFPDIDFPGVFIQVPYPGSTPEDNERLIARPIEESIATLSGVERMRSTSNAENVQIQAFFGWDRNATATGIEARAKIDAIKSELPDDIPNIFIFTGSLSDQPILTTRISSETSLKYAYDKLDRVVKRRLERIPGVARVTVYGVEPNEVRVLLNVDRLRAQGINAQAVQQALMGAQFSLSAGQIENNQQTFSIRPLGRFASIEEIRNLPIQQGVRLSDLATVELRSPDREYGRHLNQEYAVGIDVNKASGWNIVDVSDRVMAEIEKIQASPEMDGIDLFVMDNQADGIRTSLYDLRDAGAIGALLAFIVLFLFLRHIPSTLIVALSVPIALLITLAVMYFAGLSLNILSMMGLMLAIGMLVDNGVVVTESVFKQRLLDPENPFKATARGVKEVGLAVFTGTITSVIIFIPIIFGEKIDITVFLSHVAITVSAALICSLLIAQTLVPALAARVPLPAQTLDKNNWTERLAKRYGRGLSWCLRHPFIVFSSIIFVFIATVALFALSMKFPGKLVTFDAFPQESSRRLFLPYHVEGTHSLEDMEATVNRVENYLFENKDNFDIDSVYSYFEPGRAESTLLLTDKKDATKDSKDIMEEVLEGMPEIVIGKPSFKFESFGGNEGFSLQLSGTSSDVLAGLAEELVIAMERLEGLRDVRIDSAFAEQEVHVIVDETRAANLGLSANQVSLQVGAALRGTPVGEYQTSFGSKDIRLAFRDSDKQSLEDLAALPIVSPTVGEVDLAQVARFHITSGERQVNRVNRTTAEVITATLDDSTLDEVRPKIEGIMNNFELPAGYSWKFGRGFEQADKTQMIMLTNILLGIALIFIVMAALFESLLYPISIITSIFLSVVGVLWFFLITGTVFTFMASIGIMILIGLVVNNGIVLVDHINNLRRDGMGREEAIIKGAEDRLRPILMTVATTVLGLAPIAVSSTTVGGGGPPYFPMARAIIGGLLFSTAASLFVVPSVYRWLDMLSHWFRHAVIAPWLKESSKEKSVKAT